MSGKKRKRPPFGSSDSKSSPGMANVVDLSGDGDGGGGGGGADVLWQCGVCTLENESYATACAACATPRPDEGGGGGGDGGDGGGGGGGGGASSSGGASDGWTCTVCTYANADADTTCGMCGTAKVNN